jgi:hypothetical protein
MAFHLKGWERYGQDESLRPFHLKGWERYSPCNQQVRPFSRLVYWKGWNRYGSERFRSFWRSR